MRREDRILEIGSGTGWLGERLKDLGYAHYASIDIAQGADYVGDVREWRRLGLAAESFDWIVALEVIEHVDCIDAIRDLLKPAGKLFLTSPVPHFDWICRLMEGVGLTQRRTSPHSNLTYFEKIPCFELVWLRRVAGIAQWGVLEKRVPAHA